MTFIHSSTQGRRSSHKYPDGGDFSLLWVFLSQLVSAESTHYESDHIEWFVTSSHPFRSTWSPHYRALRNSVWNGVCRVLSTCFFPNSPIAMSQDMNIFRWETRRTKKSLLISQHFLIYFIFFLIIYHIVQPLGPGLHSKRIFWSHFKG